MQFFFILKINLGICHKKLKKNIYINVGVILSKISMLKNTLKSFFLKINLIK